MPRTRWSPAARSSLDAPRRVTVTGDAERLRQVVDNLLANVRAHTPPGTAAADRARAARRERRRARGRGRAAPVSTPSAPAHVFERFYRGDPSRSRDHGGSGLGLAIVAAIVHAHGGSVGVESIPGAGTTFRITLPDRQPALERLASIPPSAP